MLARKSGQLFWAEYEIKQLERMWAAGKTNREIAEHFGLTEGSMGVQIQRFRKSGRANLPRRYVKGLPAGAGVLEAVAHARGLSLHALHSKLYGIYEKEGHAFVDSILDDGVTTLGGES